MSTRPEHTLGPWVAFPSQERHHFEKPQFPEGRWVVLPANNTERLPLCEIDRADDWDAPTRASAEGDARLIAAAPELLDALKSILPLAESRVDVVMADDRHPDERSLHEKDLLEVLRTARAAIAKAEGGAS